MPFGPTLSLLCYVFIFFYVYLSLNVCKGEVEKGKKKFFLYPMEMAKNFFYTNFLCILFFLCYEEIPKKCTQIPSISLQKNFNFLPSAGKQKTFTRWLKNLFHKDAIFSPSIDNTTFFLSIIFDFF